MRVRALFLSLCLALPALAAAQSEVTPCVVDNDCSDQVFCNGAERCGTPNVNGADARGCKAAEIRTPCGVGQVCHEETDRCETLRDDRDGDGHASEATGGDDCNDNDGREFPGNQEVWDSADHDEDCNARTHGFTPGFGTTPRTGRFQACSGERVVTLTGTVGGEASFGEDACPTGTACVSQPSGDGFCLPTPAGYVPGPVLEGPRGDQVRSVASGAPSPATRPVMALPMPNRVKPAIVVPPRAPAPALAAPACVAPAVRGPTGACVLPAGTCPDGMRFDEKMKQCVKK